MVAKREIIIKNSELNNEEEIISQEQLVRELMHEPEDVWMHAIDEGYVKNQQANASNTWVVENNPDALEDYMDDVADIILPEDMDSFDW